MVFIADIEDEAEARAVMDWVKDVINETYGGAR
jgi:hypothetical protein